MTKECRVCGGPMLCKYRHDQRTMDQRHVAQMTNSGTFSNYKRELTGRGLIVKSGDGRYLPSEAFLRG